MADALIPLTPEHRGRAARALEAVEKAQHLLGDAAELLSPVPGMADEWEAVRTLYFEARDRWDAVNGCLTLLTTEKV